MNEKRNVLIISNNVISRTDNNGKTLLSFFDDENKYRIYQLYISKSLPTIDLGDDRYCQLNEIQILKRFFTRRRYSGEHPQPSLRKNAINFNQKHNLSGWRYHLAKIIREIVWKFSPIDYESIQGWVERNDIDFVFFCGGDSCFMYKIASRLSTKADIPLFLFLTDDYVSSNRMGLSFHQFRIRLIKRSIREMLRISSGLLTISDKMRDEYKEIFGSNSHVCSNIVDEALVREQGKEYSPKGNIVITYIGSLHLGRWKSLRALADGLTTLSSKFKHFDAKIIVFTNPRSVPERARDALNHPRIQIQGFQPINNLHEELNRSDFLLHLESFDAQDLDITRLAFSTKISEYLAIKIPIIAIGPLEAASIEYLKPFANCITDISNVCEQVQDIISNPKVVNLKLESASLEYAKRFDPTKVKSDLYTYIHSRLGN